MFLLVGESPNSYATASRSWSKTSSVLHNSWWPTSPPCSKRNTKSNNKPAAASPLQSSSSEKTYLCSGCTCNPEQMVIFVAEMLATTADGFTCTDLQRFFTCTMAKPAFLRIGRSNLGIGSHCSGTFEQVTCKQRPKVNCSCKCFAGRDWVLICSSTKIFTWSAFILGERFREDVSKWIDMSKAVILQGRGP